jgi:hypothetical protein
MQRLRQRRIECYEVQKVHVTVGQNEHLQRSLKCSVLKTEVGC